MSSFSACKFVLTGDIFAPYSVVIYMKQNLYICIAYQSFQMINYCVLSLINLIVILLLRTFLYKN